MNRLDQLKRYDVITFDEDDKVIVLARQDYNGRKYVFVNEVLPDESDVTDIYKVMEIHLEDGTLERVIDPKVLQEILPLFEKQLENFETESEERTDRIDEIFGTFEELDGKLYTVADYERIVKKAMAAQDIEPLIEHSEKMMCSNKPSALSLNKEFTYTSWCEFLNKNGSEWACNYLFDKYAVVGDYDMASWTKECFIEGLKERGEYVAPILYYQVGYYKYMQINDDLPMEQMIQLYEGKILATGHWYKKALEAGFSEDSIVDGKWCISYYDNYKNKATTSKGNSEWCYIATAIYGSYDCPEVWTLRRFRDDVLRRYWLGVLFVKLYYKMSPVLVKHFGEEDWFNKIFKYILDSFVNKLNSKGINNTQYYDK